MKMRIRKPVLAFLVLTVVAPIFLYTDKLSTFSPTDEFFQEISSSFTLNQDASALNLLLPQESFTPIKEPLGVVYSDNQNSTQNISNSDDSEKSRTTRQLNEESNGINSSIVIEDNRIDPIKQVTQEAEEHKTTLLTTQTVTKQAVEVTQNQVSERNPANGKTEKRKQRDVKADERVRLLKDQLIRARVYLSLSATRTNYRFNRELRLHMKEIIQTLGHATKDSQLPKNANEKMKAMEQTLAKGMQIQEHCFAIVNRLQSIIHSTEKQLRVHEKQTLYLTQLTAKTVPKGLHCLPLRLSADYYSLNKSSSKRQFPNQEKLEDPKLFHYALFSDNVLATSVVVNSTVSNAIDSSKHVFHIVTDKLNYAAMRMWFLANPPANATIQVQKVEEFTWLNASYSPVLKQLASQKMIDYYFKTHRGGELDSNLKYRNPKYLSIMNHLRFYLPEIFPKLNKIVFLDDDIVVQKDLTKLWSLDMKGKVNGAVETCRESFHRFDRYLNFSNPLIAKNFDPHACGWAYGMNVFDLDQWKKQNITEIYHSWQNLNEERELWKLGTLPPGLITFYKRVFPMEKSWHVLGLGYNQNVNEKEIEKASVIHYNGNLKPWLEIGIPKFRRYWSRYVNYDELYMRECNITPL